MQAYDKITKKSDSQRQWYGLMGKQPVVFWNRSTYQV